MFDTHALVQRLEGAGYGRQRATALMEAISSAVCESDAARAGVVATKPELLELKGELGEKVFNATLKFDIAQRHLREIVDKDLQNLKSELRAAERADSAEMRAEIGSLEKARAVRACLFSGARDGERARQQERNGI